MNKYQVLFIIDIDSTDEKKQELVEKFSELVVSLGGEVNSVEKWGAKKYAYPINYKKEGYYVLMKITAGADVPAELDRQMKINENIVRQMITKI
jgi:small subunit ribosomal protein S6